MGQMRWAGGAVPDPKLLAANLNSAIADGEMETCRRLMAIGADPYLNPQGHGFAEGQAGSPMETLLRQTSERNRKLGSEQIAQLAELFGGRWDGQSVAKAPNRALWTALPGDLAKSLAECGVRFEYSDALEKWAAEGKGQSSEKHPLSALAKDALDYFKAQRVLEGPKADWEGYWELLSGKTRLLLEMAPELGRMPVAMGRHWKCGPFTTGNMPPAQWLCRFWLGLSAMDSPVPASALMDSSGWRDPAADGLSFLNGAFLATLSGFVKAGAALDLGLADEQGNGLAHALATSPMATPGSAKEVLRLCPGSGRALNFWGWDPLSLRSRGHDLPPGSEARNFQSYSEAHGDKLLSAPALEALLEMPELQESCKPARKKGPARGKQL